MLQWRQIFRLSYGQFVTGLLTTLRRWSPALVVFVLLVYLQAREVRSTDGFIWVQSLVAVAFFVVLLGVQRRTLPVAPLSPLLPVTRFDLWAGQVLAAFLATLTSAGIALASWGIFWVIYQTTRTFSEVTVVANSSLNATLASGDDTLWTPFSRGWAILFVFVFAVVVRHLIPLSTPLHPYRVMQWVQRSRRTRRSPTKPNRLSLPMAKGVQTQNAHVLRFPARGMTFSVLVFVLTPIVAPILAIQSSFLFFAGAIVALMTLLHHGLRPSALSPRALRAVVGAMGGVALVGMGTIYLIAVSDLQHATAERKLAAADFLGFLSRVSDDDILRSSLASGALAPREIKALGMRYRLQKGHWPQLSGSDVDNVFQQSSAGAVAVWSEWITPESWTPAVVERFASKVTDADLDLTTHPVRNAFGTESAHWIGWLKSDSRILQYLALQGLSSLSASSPQAAAGVQSVIYQYASSLISKSIEDRASAIPSVLWAQALSTASLVSGMDVKTKIEREGRIEVARSLAQAAGEGGAHPSP